MDNDLQLVNDRSAWSGADFSNDESWIYELSTSEVEDQLASAARRMAGALP